VDERYVNTAWTGLGALTFQQRRLVVEAAAVHGLSRGRGVGLGGLEDLPRVGLLGRHHPRGGVAHRLGVVVLTVVLPDRRGTTTLMTGSDTF